MNEEVYAIVLQVKGEEEAKRLAAETKRLEDEIKSLKSSFAAGNVVMPVYKQNLGELQAAKVRLTKEVESATRAYQSMATAQNLAQRATTGGTDAVSRYGSALSQLGYIADDAQYGLKGLTNNIQPLASALGMGAGLAGVIGIVAIGAKTLYDNWDSVEKLWGGGKTEEQVKVMKALDEATKAYKKTLEELQKMQGAGVDANKAAAKSAIGQVGFPQAEKDIMAALADYNKRNGIADTRPIKEQANILLRNAVEGKGGAEQFLTQLIGGGTPFANTLTGEAYARATGTGGNGESPEERRRREQREREASARQQILDDEAKAKADAEALRAKTMSWVEDENRVGERLANREGRSLTEVRREQQKRDREKGDLFRQSDVFAGLKAQADAMRQAGAEPGVIEARLMRQAMDAGLGIEESQRATKGLLRPAGGINWDAVKGGGNNFVNPLGGIHSQMMRDITAGPNRWAGDGGGGGLGGSSHGMHELLHAINKNTDVLRTFKQDMRSRTFPAVVR